MNSRFPALVVIMLIGLVASFPIAAEERRRATRPFQTADLNVTITAAGTANLWVDLDDTAWKQATIVRPDGREILDVEATGPLRDFGLGEVSAGTNAPPLRDFPMEKFRQLFPEGTYVITATLVDGTKLRSEVPLTHDFPAAPVITYPRNGATLPSDDVVIRWRPSLSPAGAALAGYRVVVTRGDGNGTFRVDLPTSVRQLPVPPAFHQRQTSYRADVFAIATSGNRTTATVTYTVD